ncbi:hypothetical protein SO802_009145 [Lithocarpus litseifolius]|uniref:Uncharacterized protein n=1 Tax=Lithocarpus litseifolius TaxID=425828 RepID=A0AAW2DDE0_9ROSI
MLSQLPRPQAWEGNHLRLNEKFQLKIRDKCNRLKKFNNEIDREVNRLSTAVEKEKKRAELGKTRGLLVDTLNTYKTAFQPCRDEMLEMASKQEELEKNLRDYEMLMIQKMPRFKKVYSQQKSSIETDISGFRVNEQLLQQMPQRSSRDKEPLIDLTSSPISKRTRQSLENFDNKIFKTVQDSQSFNNNFENAPFVVERIVRFDTLGSTFISKIFADKDWDSLFGGFEDPIEKLIKEFYSNA